MRTYRDSMPLEDAAAGTSMDAEVVAVVEAAATVVAEVSRPAQGLGARLRSLLARARRGASLVWAVFSFLLFVPWMLPFALLARSRRRPWVISGHRGRMRADNAGVLHDHLRACAGQATVWIADTADRARALRSDGILALPQHSLAARWAILTAPVLIYSHGESDLDLMLVFLRPVLGLRVYLNHCMHHLKAGDWHSPGTEELRGLRRWLFGFLVTDFDIVLASSEKEAANFALSYPARAGGIRLGGGAHIDTILGLRGTPTDRSLFWFPTFRDDAAGAALLRSTIRAVASSPRLRSWLVRTGRRLVVGTHINSGDHGMELAGPVEFVPPSEILERMGRCEAYISDWSGTLLDYLALDKPAVFFPFDRAEYLRHRRLFVEYDEVAFGPVVDSAEALVDSLVSERWLDQAPYASRRASLRAAIFPRVTSGYARSSYETIVRELERSTPE